MYTLFTDLLPPAALYRLLTCEDITNYLINSTCTQDGVERTTEHVGNYMTQATYSVNISNKLVVTTEIHPNIL